MTLTTTSTRRSYTAGGVSGIFAYDFLVLTAAELLVYLDDVLQPGSAYTVSGLGLGSGGNVTLAAIPAAGVRVDLIRATDQTQQVNLQEGDDLPSEQVEGVFDKVYAAVQDLAEKVKRAFKIPPTGATATTEPLVPNLVSIAGKALRVNATGTGVEGFTILSSDIASPITTTGDLIRGSSLGAAERLPIGTAGQLLTVVSGQSAWATPSAQGIPVTIMQAKGDLIVATAASSAFRKAVGSTGAALLADPSTSDGLAWLLGAALHGRVRLRRTSPTQLTLGPCDGNTVYVKDANGWRLRSIGAGVLADNVTTYVDGVSPSNLAANTDYLVTLFDNSGVLTLDYRTTLTHAPDADFGVEILTGTPTRTVVGRIRTNSIGQFADSAAQRFVLSWFNRRTLSGSSTFSVNRTTASASFVELHAEIRVEFLTWADEAVAASSAGTLTQAAGGNVLSGLAFDGTTPSAVGGGVSKDVTDLTMSLTATLAEGYHYLTLVGATSGGTTGTWQSSDTAPNTGKCRTFVLVRG